jgi:hypothetical protein
MGLVDWWYRFEWQHHRGSVHVHSIAKRKEAPEIDWEKMKNNDEIMEEVVHYLDSLVTTIDPGLNAPPLDHHLCQKRSEDLNNDMQDYIELINKLQRHTRCSSYCLWCNKQTGKQNCRFGFPKELVDKTTINDNNGHLELTTVRNDPLINPHDRIQLQGWRANVDLKPILTTHAALQYVLKYAGKAEPRSLAFSEVLDKALRNDKPNDPAVKAFQKLLIHTVGERDFSAQETCHHFLQLPLYNSSRNFVSLNLNKEANRQLRDSNENDPNNENNGIMKTEPSPLQKYCNRPAEFEELSLFKLYQQYKLVKGNWVECPGENVVRIWPCPSPIRNGPQWEEFCRVKVLLHVRYRDLLTLTENNTLSWIDLYNQHLLEINDDLMI